MQIKTWGIGKSDIRQMALLICFAILGLLQLLDWHSTFLAIDAGRSEQNGLILWISHYVGLKTSVSLFKAIAVLTVFFYCRLALRRQGTTVVLVPLGLLLLVYAVVVHNNYSH